MRSLTLLKILLISLVGSSLLCVLAFFSLRSIGDIAGSSHRQELAIRIAKEFESGSIADSLQAYLQRHVPGTPGARTKIWMVDDKGQLLGSTSKESLPFEWDDRCRPAVVHDIAVHYNSLLSLSPEFTCVRLDSRDIKADSSSSQFLVIRIDPRRAPQLLWGTSFLFIFVTVAMAVFLALTLSFFYLQRKSKEAKDVLRRIENGDLEARFQIQQFDEIGSLMLDFNRMADHLHKLILRVHAAERSRRSLLQELGHDVRTPLTSLKTSLETLRLSFPQMSEKDREEFFGVMDAELHYLMRLLEDLFFIADLDEPHFKANLEKVDLHELLSSEVRSRQQNSMLRWSVNGVSPVLIMGDPHLIMRLFKNALDNAARFATTKIHIEFLSDKDHWEIVIDDDGPGLSKQALQEFAHRRQSRIQASAGSSHVSLGLGSVIMKSIAELHEGSVEIQNEIEDGKIIGARQKIRLHK